MADLNDTELARVIWLLRRTTFGPAPALARQLPSLSLQAVTDAVLGRDSELSFADPVFEVPDADDDDRASLLRWWIDQMRRPDAGLHEKMVWFWHSHFTSSVEKCSPAALRNQHELVRRHALGNFRELARAMVTDGAMLLYLDGSGSQGDNPNENLARELMELFTIGRGTYNERDVREAAKVLSGWWVDWETGDVHHEPDATYQGRVRFLGSEGRFTPAQLVDIICDQPTCASFIAAKLHRFLVGVDADEASLVELAAIFADNDFAIGALVDAIVTSPAMAATSSGRPRSGIEWFVAAANALELGETTEEHLWLLEQLGQVPFHPPNPAGWSDDSRWLAPASQLSRATALIALIADHPDLPEFDADHPIPQILRHCAIPDPSVVTSEALSEGLWAPFPAEDVNALLLFGALSSPEFAIA